MALKYSANGDKTLQELAIKVSNRKIVTSDAFANSLEQMIDREISRGNFQGDLNRRYVHIMATPPFNYGHNPDDPIDYRVDLKEVDRILRSRYVNDAKWDDVSINYNDGPRGPHFSVDISKNLMGKSPKRIPWLKRLLNRA